MIVSLIWAMSLNGVIGRNNRLPWRLPDEYGYFRKKVRGRPVIMGRKTLDAMARPLKHSLNIVLTRSEKEVPGCVCVPTFSDALRIAEDEGKFVPNDEVFVIGGAQIYELAMCQSVRLYRTVVDAEIEGDTFFPEYDTSQWKRVWSKSHEADERHSYAFTMEVFERRNESS